MYITPMTAVYVFMKDECFRLERIQLRELYMKLLS